MVWALETSALTSSDTVTPNASQRVPTTGSQLFKQSVEAILVPTTSHHGVFCPWVVSVALEVVAVAERIPGYVACAFSLNPVPPPKWDLLIRLSLMTDSQ